MAVHFNAFPKGRGWTLGVAVWAESAVQVSAIRVTSPGMTERLSDQIEVADRKVVIDGSLAQVSSLSA